MRILTTLAVTISAGFLMMMKNDADQSISAEQKVATAKIRAVEKLKPLLTKHGLKLGDELFIRVFKESKELEVWLRGFGQEKYKRLKTYKICTFSGKLGPKLKQGDRQAPEGFYFVTRKAMNPNSSYHLSFDLGYPNSYDRSHSRTGDFLMIHGNCVSAGCYAMTDPLIEEIYTLADAALTNGQNFFRVHCFPFRMTHGRMQKAEEDGSKWLGFWKNLKEGYDWFERKKSPPDTTVSGKTYKFSETEE